MLVPIIKIKEKFGNKEYTHIVGDRTWWGFINPLDMCWDGNGWRTYKNSREKYEKTDRSKYKNAQGI